MICCALDKSATIDINARDFMKDTLTSKTEEENELKNLREIRRTGSKLGSNKKGTCYSTSRSYKLGKIFF